jgi:hypothetical protein
MLHSFWNTVNQKSLTYFSRCFGLSLCYNLWAYQEYTELNLVGHWTDKQLRNEENIPTKHTIVKWSKENGEKWSKLTSYSSSADTLRLSVITVRVRVIQNSCRCFLFAQYRRVNSNMSKVSEIVFFHLQRTISPVMTIKTTSADFCPQNDGLPSSKWHGY